MHVSVCVHVCVCVCLSSLDIDGLIIIETNGSYELDKAMHHRIMIAIKFRQPDHLLHITIWESHAPKQMKMADDINQVSECGDIYICVWHCYTCRCMVNGSIAMATFYVIQRKIPRLSFVCSG